MLNNHPLYLYLKIDFLKFLIFLAIFRYFSFVIRVYTFIVTITRNSDTSNICPLEPFFNPFEGYFPSITRNSDLLAVAVVIVVVVDYEKTFQ